MPHRSILLALFQASGGHLIHQRSLEAHALQFLTKHNLLTEALEATTVAFRLRVMMSHLREAKANQRVPPFRYDSLRCILDIIRLEPPEPELEAVDEFAVGPYQGGWAFPQQSKMGISSARACAV